MNWFILLCLISLSPTAALALGVALPGLMGASRVLADDHWATDVIGGWLLGGAIAGTVCGMGDERRRELANSD